MTRTSMRWTVALAFLLGCTGLAATAAAAPRCLSDCTSRIGIVSAFGQEAAILVAETKGRRTWTINGNTFTTGTLRGNRVVIVLSGVSMINATMTTQLLLDHFRVERLLMSGIAGGVDPAHHVGDVIVPERWVMPMEVYWNHDASLPAPCGKPNDVSCLGLKLAPYPSYVQGNGTPSGLFMRENHLRSAAVPGEGEFMFDYAVDPEMLQVARALKPALSACGPRARATPDAAPDPKLCVGQAPKLVVGGRGVSGTAFLANPGYRAYLFETLQAQTVDMETTALAHVARANGVPYLAFRSLSDLAGAEEFNADVAALFASGLAETNEAVVTLSFLEAWAAHRRAGVGQKLK